MPTLTDYLEQAAAAQTDPYSAMGYAALGTMAGGNKTESNIPVRYEAAAKPTGQSLSRLLPLIGKQYVVGQNITQEALSEMIRRSALEDGISDADASKMLQDAGFEGAFGSGKFMLAGAKATGKGGGTIQPATGGAQTVTPTPTPGAKPTSPGATYPGGPGSYPSSSPNAGSYQGLPGWGGGNSGSPGFSATVGGAPGNPLANFDPSKPLGLDPSKFSGAPVGGSPDFRSGTFPSAGDPFAGIGPGSSAQDVALALAKKQFANQQASLGIYGGLYDKYQSDPALQGARGLAGQLAANPFSLDDTTKSRIAGRGVEQIGNRAGLLETQARDRAAASGASRGGGLEDRIGSIQTNAANQAGNLERNLDIEQATRRPQELSSALSAVGGFGQADAAGRSSIGMGAADRVLGQTSILGDALLTGPLLAGGGAGKVNVNLPWQGYKLE